MNTHTNFFRNLYQFRAIVFILFFILIQSCQNQTEEINGEEALNKSIQFHDPQNNWSTVNLKIHIQEPRISNPYRYSILNLDLSDNTFELSRNRDEHISRHTIDANGNSEVFLDGEDLIDSALIEKYRLDPTRNSGYRDFYELIYGLPMSLKDRLISIQNSGTTVFNSKIALKFRLKLKNPMISKHWILYLDIKNYNLLGVDIISEENSLEGERLYFEDYYELDGMKLARMRHWYNLTDTMYSGSDIILKSID